MESRLVLYAVRYRTQGPGCLLVNRHRYILKMAFILPLMSVIMDFQD